MNERTGASLERRAERMRELLDSMDLGSLGAMLTDDAQSVDEITRGWTRGRAAIEAYMSQLKDTVSDVQSRMSGAQETVWGDVGWSPSYSIRPTRWTVSSIPSPRRRRSCFASTMGIGRSP